MTTENRYVVLRCARCRLINPYQRRECARCGETRRAIISASHEEVMAAAAEFEVQPEVIAAPPRMVASIPVPESAWARLLEQVQRAFRRAGAGTA